MSLTNRGILREFSERHGDAEYDFRRALDLAPDDPDAAGRYGVFLFLRERFGEAVEMTRQAVEKAPGGRYGYLHAAALHSRNQAGDRERAVEMWSEIARRGRGDEYGSAVWYAVRGLCGLERPNDARPAVRHPGGSAPASREPGTRGPPPAGGG